MALKDWRRNWSIGGEYPEWNNSTNQDILTVYEGDTPDKFSVAIVNYDKKERVKNLIKNVSENKALKKSKDYMKSH